MLSVRDILMARERLAEHRAKAYLGDEGTNETDITFTRYWAGIPETELDLCLEFLRRWVSIRNQMTFDLKVTGAILPEVNGTYVDSGEVAHGHAVYRRNDDAFEFRVAVLADEATYYWQLIRLSDDKVIWLSSAGEAKLLEGYDELSGSDFWTLTDDGILVPIPLGTASTSLSQVVWTPAEVLHDAADDLVVADDWFPSDVGVIEPVTGALAVAYNLPDKGIQYRSVTDPKVNDGKPRKGIWRAGQLRHVQDTEGRYGQKDGWVILQTLHLELNQLAPITEGETRWRLMDGQYPRSGSRNLVLELPYCDPSLVQTLAEENTDTLYDSSIYTVNAGLLSGKWYHYRTVAEIDQQTGFGRLLWYVRNHQNDDMIFSWMANENERRAEFIKLNMPPDGIESFKTTYYFDASGNFYVSADGINYTAKNGSAAAGALPADAKLLSDNPAGRIIADYSAAPDEETGEVNLHIALAWFTNAPEKGIIYRGRYGEVITSIALEDVTETRRDAFVEYTYLDDNGNWYYSEDDANYTAKNGVAAAGPLPASARDFEQLEIEGYRLRVVPRKSAATQLWTVLVECMKLVSDTRCSYIGVGDTRISYRLGAATAMTIDMAYNITKAELDQALVYYATIPADGTMRQMSPPRRDPETGLYSYEALEIASTKVAASIRIGSEVIYIGENYDKEPTTDLALFNADNPEAVGVLPESDNYYLIGANWTGAAWTCLIDTTSTTIGTPEYNPENNTWNWRIRHITPAEESVGSDDPESDTSDYIFQSGDAQDYNRFVCTKTGQTITPGALSFLSYWEDVPANTFGVHAALPDRRKVTPFIRNSKVIDGKLDYELWERVQTPDINDNDAWYYMGGTESLNRNKEDLASETIQRNGSKYPGGSLEYSTFYEILQQANVNISTADGDADGKLSLAEMQTDNDSGGYISTTTPILARLQLASKQRRTVERSRIFFLRRPTDSDLDNIIDSGVISVKDAWDAVLDEQTAGTAPNALEVKTFDIIKVGDQWAIERMIVRIDDQIYKDADAMDHFFDSDGNSMCGIALLPLHDDATLDSIVTDETEA